MYSVVLLAAMAATEKAPAHGWTKHHGYGYCYGGCYGACYAGWPHAAGGWGLPYAGYWAGYGCYMPHGGHDGVPFGLHTPAFAPAPSTYAPVDEKSDEKRPERKYDKEDGDKGKKDEKKGKEDADNKSQVRARLLFVLPRGGALFVDGHRIEGADVRKSFRTPPLEKGEQYYYELRVEVVRDGRKYVESRKITLAAGDEVKTDFSTVGSTTGVATAEPVR
ncbi:MAG: TIGR03000 domain-containing protein [Gemmataceae bacterium]